MNAGSAYVIAAVLFFLAAVFSAFAPDLGIAFSAAWIALGCLFLILGFRRRL